MKTLEELQKRLLEIRYVRDEEREEYVDLMEKIHNLGNNERIFSVLCSGFVDESVDANNDVIHSAWREHIESFYDSHRELEYVNLIIHNADIFIPHAKNILSYLIFRILNRVSTKDLFLKRIANISPSSERNFFILKELFLEDLKTEEPHELSKEILSYFKE